METEEEFQVRDRRAYLAEDAPAAVAKPGAEANRPGSPAASGGGGRSTALPDASSSPGDPSPHDPPAGALPQVNFISFISSLAMAVMHHLGRGEEGASVSLPNAQQTIDLLALLQEKTKGNLTEEEEQAMTGILYTLRMNFVAVERESRRP